MRRVGVVVLGWAGLGWAGLGEWLRRLLGLPLMGLLLPVCMAWDGWSCWRWGRRLVVSGWFAGLGEEVGLRLSWVYGWLLWRVFAPAGVGGRLSGGCGRDVGC